MSYPRVDRRSEASKLAYELRKVIEAHLRRSLEDYEVDRAEVEVQ